MAAGREEEDDEEEDEAKAVVVVEPTLIFCTSKLMISSHSHPPGLSLCRVSWEILWDLPNLPTTASLSQFVGGIRVPLRVRGRRRRLRACSWVGVKEWEDGSWADMVSSG